MTVETRNQVVTEAIAGGVKPPVEKPGAVLEHAGLIARYATFDAHKPIDELDRKLVEKGVGSIDRAVVMFEADKAREELGRGKMAEAAAAIDRKPEDLVR